GSRHTRFSRDWSSDVCSSDLAALAARQRHRVRCVAAGDARADVARIVHISAAVGRFAPHSIAAGDELKERGSLMATERNDIEQEVGRAAWRARATIRGGAAWT